MDRFNPDTYCGIYCGACSIVMRSETGRTDGFAACLGSVPKEELACGGCKSDTVYAGCSTCSLRHCAREKGVAHCIDCTDYPCKIYSKWQSAAKFSFRTAARLHPAWRRLNATALPLGSRRRKSAGRAPTAARLFHGMRLECYKCGRRLASEAYQISGWRKLLCRFVLPMAYRKGKAKRPMT